MRAIISRRSSIKSHPKTKSRPCESKSGRKHGESTFYESAIPETGSITRKARNLRENRRLNNDDMAIDRRLYQRHSAVWSGSRSTGNSPSSSQSELIEDDGSHSGAESGDGTSRVSRFAGDAPRSAELGGATAVPHSGMSEDVTTTGRSSTADSGMVDGSSRRPHPTVKLRRHDGLSGTEARERRTSWAMKRLHSTASASVQKSLDLDDGAGSNEEGRGSSVERSAVVNVDLEQRSSASCAVLSARTNRTIYEENSEEEEGTNFAQEMEVDGDMLQTTDGIVTDSRLKTAPDRSTQLRSDLSVTRREKAVPRRSRSNRDCDDAGTSSPSQSRFASVTDPLLVSGSVDETEKQEAAISTVSKDEPTVVSPVAVSDSRRSHVHAGTDAQQTAKSGGDGHHSGTYRTSYGPGHDETKSAAAAVCSPGTVRYFRDLFERAASSSITSPGGLETTSPSPPVVVVRCRARGASAGSGVPGDSERRRAAIDGFQSTSSGVRSPRVSTSSDGRVDSTASESPVVCQHVSPLMERPPPRTDSVQENSCLSDHVQRSESKINLEQSSMLDDFEEVRPDWDLFQVRRTSSVEDDDLQRRFPSTSEFDRATIAPRRSISDSDRSYRSCANLPVCRDAARPDDVDRMDRAVGVIQNGVLTGGSQCVSIIAWHRPYRRPRPALRAPASGFEHRALLNNGMCRRVPAICGTLRTVEIEIARHKPEL